MLTSPVTASALLGRAFPRVREIADSLIFDAGIGLALQDGFVAFEQFEATHLDWLEDFLRDPAMSRLLEVLRDPPDEQEEVTEFEEYYAKGELCTFNSAAADYS